MKMIEVVNKNLDVMCVPHGKIPAGWTLYEDRRKFPRPAVPEGTDKRPAAVLARVRVAKSSDGQFVALGYEMVAGE